MKFLLLRCGDNKEKQGTRDEPFFTSGMYPPLGLLHIGAALEQDGHTVEVIDFYHEPLSDERLQQILQNVDAVGMSIYTDNYEYSGHIIEKIKKIKPSIPVIIGGPHCIFFKKQSLSMIPQADIGVIGEGDHVILHIVRYLQGKKNLADIHGIVYRKNGQIKLGKSLQVVQNLDSLPIPARHLVEKYDYGKFPGGDSFKKKFTSMLTSRGCPFHCRFCARYGNVINKYKFRQRSAASVIKEFQELDKQYRSVMIVDDNFLADIKRAHAICDALIAMNSGIELLIMGARVDSANEELYRKMRRAGVRYVGFGIESGNQDVLDYYKKNITIEQIRKAVKLSRRMGFFTNATFILGAPIEDKNHLENTIKFACSLPLDLAIFGVLHYHMGSELWDEAVQQNIISKDDYLTPVTSKRGVGNFTYEELRRYCALAFKRFYLRPSYLLDQFARAAARRDIGYIKNGFRFMAFV